MVYVDRSEHIHNTAFAISAGSPKRPTRLIRLITSASSEPRAAIAPRNIGVSMAPGATALTRTPIPAYSMAAVLVSPITPCFVAVYAACLGNGRKEFVEA